MFNKKQNQKIERLENQVRELEIRVRELETKLEYYEYPHQRQPSIINADEIMQRFGELYEHLGIERKIEPSKPAMPKLTKSKKPSDA